MFAFPSGPSLESERSFCVRHRRAEGAVSTRTFQAEAGPAGGILHREEGAPPASAARWAGTPALCARRSLPARACSLCMRREPSVQRPILAFPLYPRAGAADLAPAPTLRLTLAFTSSPTYRRCDG